MPWKPSRAALARAPPIVLYRYSSMERAMSGCSSRRPGYIQVSASQKICPA
jgi:hypothetical protein